MSFLAFAERHDRGAALRSLVTALTLLLATIVTRDVSVHGQSPAAVEEQLAAHLRGFAAQAQPLLQKYCHECHAADRVEAEINLADFKTGADVQRQPQVWQKVAEILDSQQMPPLDARQPTEAERQALRSWVQRYLQIEAVKSAGDPGRVVLRRLNNAEYSYTLRDLTGVPTLNPAREFPVDGAAGEGFTNTGAALSMSPALVTKYLDAAKEVAQHAVLLPSGIRFSPNRTRSDWTNEKLAEIREFYRRYTHTGGGDRVNLQGIVFDTNQGGRLPLERYLLATLEQRDALRSGQIKLDTVAQKYDLSPKYLTTLWTILQAAPTADNKTTSSMLLDPLRIRWRAAQPADANAIAVEVARWQQALWRFTSVGHIGKLNGPKAWMEPVSPLTERQEFKMKLTPPADGSDLVLYLVTGDAGDGAEQDLAIWERPRLVAPGRPDVLLRDVRAVTQELTTRREQMFSSAAACLQAAATIQARSAANENSDVAVIAAQFQVPPEMLTAWLDYLGIDTGSSGAAKIGQLISTKIEKVANYDAVSGWSAPNALSVLANSSDQLLRVPGNMKPHSIAVHPSPTQSVGIAWRSPVAGKMKITGSIQHAHPECGNGTAWVVELRRGATRQRLAAGNTNGANVIAFGPLENLAMQVDDVIAVVVNPRDGNHACDLTAVDLTISSADRSWDLGKEVSPKILSGNPHADSQGNPNVWHFFWEPASGTNGPTIPGGSLLAKWQVADGAQAKQQLASELQKLLQTGVANLPKDSPDGNLYRELTALGGPLLSSALRKLSGQPAGGKPGAVPAPPAKATAPAASSTATTPADRLYGLDPALFGPGTRTIAIDPASLAVAAPAVLEVRLPGNLAAGAELVASGFLPAEDSARASVQLQVLTTKPASANTLQPSTVEQTNANGPWTSNNRGISHGTPILVAKASSVRERLEQAFDEFRQLFPPALCYTKIVPVDEVVTLTLFYREDDQLCRLMLNDRQTAQLNQLWQELHFVSQDALTLVDAYAQLMEYATQDADPKVFEPLRKPINDRAAAFRQQLIEAEPRHLDSVIEFARQAVRRPLAEAEANQLRQLYAGLRQQEIPHDDAIRLTIARVLVSPAFLYRAEVPVAGNKPGAVTAWELANRLSYFIWSSQPDAELRRVAASGELLQPAVLQAQTRRLLRDPKARRLAIEFACQWLHIHDFAQFDEKSEQAFPTFADLRSSMYEESIRFFTDLFQNQGSVLSIVSADHTFLNEKLAQHYGLPWSGAATGTAATGTAAGEDLASATGAPGPWRRVEGVKQQGRGGILTQAATLSKQAGASRTSPILRGNWVSEVVLGEKLPRPPKGVPPLAETTPQGLTERQLIEQHSADAACAKCHARIDPLGFALENFDAIGRFRQKDAAGLAIDANTKLLDGTKVEGLTGIRDYVSTTRREAFVRQFNKKLLGYALGRAVQLSDMPLIGELNEAALTPSGHVGAIIEQIVLSPQFREIRGRETASEE